MLTAKQKDLIINNRGESDKVGSRSRSYTVIFKNGKKCSLICMNGESKEDAEKSCLDRFRGKFSHIETGKTYEELKADRHVSS